MKKIILIIIVIVLLGGVIFISTKQNKDSVENVKDDKDKTEYLIYSSQDIGLKFQYSSDYVIDERMPVDLGEEMIKTIILHRKEDVANPPPVGGEGAPVITIAVFVNKDKQSSRVWASSHEQYSSLKLQTSSETETVVGGANALQYMTDGLYATENFVVAYGGNAYVISGQFIDQNSQIRDDFVNLVKTITFIPKQGQE